MASYVDLFWQEVSSKYLTLISQAHVTYPCQDAKVTTKAIKTIQAIDSNHIEHKDPWKLHPQD